MVIGDQRAGRMEADNIMLIIILSLSSNISVCVWCMICNVTARDI